MHTPRFVTSVLGAAAALALTLSAQQPPQGGQPPAPTGQQPTEIRTIISSGDPGLPPKLAVPDFIAAAARRRNEAAAKTIGEVLWNDIAFEKEFYMIPQDTYRSIPQPAALDQVPLDRWKELGADGGAGRQRAQGWQRRDRAGPADQRRDGHVGDGQGVLGRGAHAAAERGRLYAHTIGDETAQGTARG